MSDYRALCAELDTLLAETYALWPEGWVSFNWRGYTYDHVRRVRALALHLAQVAGADTTVVELAALLHDLTKPWDGEYLLDAQGQRVVDEHGLWRNVVRPPERANAVTRRYDALGLAGLVHHVAGAALADDLLAARGLPADLRARVARSIRDHLIPPDDAPLESHCLYDADTIDANIGLPAFVRNIYIHLHFYDARRAPEQPPIEVVLRERPLEYLRPYVRENLLRWVEGKQRDFIPRLLTAAARELATARIERLRALVLGMGEELDEYESCSLRGALAVVLYLMGRRGDPSIAQEAAYLSNGWLAAHDATPRACELVAALQREIAGLD